MDEQEHRDNVIPLTSAKRPLGIEDCTICGINRSVCMDTQCPGDYRGDVPFIGQLGGPA